MIQRIQTIWLVLSALTLACLLFVPMVTSSVSQQEFYIIASGLYQKSTTGVLQVEKNMALFLSTIVLTLLPLANIFSFKSRTLQKRLITLNILLIIGLSYWCSVFAQKIPGGIESANYSIGMFLPVLAIVFCVLAIKGINNDEKLIRSADRLR